MAAMQKTAIWQRIQVAIVGLILVSGTIFGANILVDKAVEDADLVDANLQQDIAETGTAEPEDSAPTEPLSELGVSPTPKEEDTAQPAEVAEPGANPVSEDELFIQDEE